MDFTRRKLPQEAALNLRICPVASVKPYALMMAPVYVYFKANTKFVSVKAPLDFFTAEELERYKSFESFYMPEFVDQSLEFRQVGRNVRSMISWKPTKDGKEQLPPAPYEISDAVLRLMGPLWGAGAVIEPFFAAVFANEFCDLLPEGSLKKARDLDVDGYDRSILRSSWAVFLALHLGYCDLSFLNALRLRVFESSNAQASSSVSTGEVDELLEIVWTSLGENAATQVKADVFEEAQGRAAQKLFSRLKRVRESGMIRAEAPVPTIFGERGFVDV